MDIIEGEGKRKRKTKAKMKKKLKIVIHRDSQGKYVIINGKRVRINNTIKPKKLAKEILHKMNLVSPGLPMSSISFEQSELPDEIKDTKKQIENIRSANELINSRIPHSREAENSQKRIENEELIKREKVVNEENLRKWNEANAKLKEELVRKHQQEEENLVNLEDKILDLSQMNRDELLTDLIVDDPDEPDYHNYEKYERYKDLSKKDLIAALINRFNTIGYGKSNIDKGMSNFQIDNILNKYPNYLGCISHNEIKTRIIPHIKPKSKGGFVINTDPSSKPGEHWQSVYFDATPGGEAEIDFFDSYGDPIDKTLQRDLLSVANKLNAGTYLKFKENRIRYQNDISSNCGWFATKFLIDRFRGKPFIDATGFNDVKQGEASINHFKAQHGGKFITFPYVASFGGSVVDFRQNYPVNVQKYVNDETPIKSLIICREPISNAINGLLNIVSLGGWNRAKKELGYDKLFHLYFIINGNLKLERNHVVTMGPSSLKSNAERMYVNLPPGKPITIGELLQKTAQLVGPDLQRYDPSSRNCQEFIIQVLRANGLLNDTYKAFVLQDIESIFKKVPKYVHWIGQLTTDAANKLEELRGNGK
jgi:hypothetical protein